MRGQRGTDSAHYPVVLLSFQNFSSSQDGSSDDDYSTGLMNLIRVSLNFTELEWDEMTDNIPKVDIEVTGRILVLFSVVCTEASVILGVQQAGCLS